MVTQLKIMEKRVRLYVPTLIAGITLLITKIREHYGNKVEYSSEVLKSNISCS